MLQVGFKFMSVPFSGRFSLELPTGQSKLGNIIAFQRGKGKGKI
jgi:hypothetical protein